MGRTHLGLQLAGEAQAPHLSATTGPWRPHHHPRGVPDLPERAAKIFRTFY